MAAVAEGVRREAWLAVGAVILLGCSTYKHTVRARAAVDFRCDASNVEVQELPGSAYVASGCGETATYVCSGGNSVGPTYGGAPGAGAVTTMNSTPISCAREGGTASSTSETARSCPPGTLSVQGVCQPVVDTRCPHCA